MSEHLSPLERQLVLATQAGLPLVPRPYAQLAAQVHSDEATVIATMQALLARGVIRRVAAVPNHYAIGYTFNGMTVWDVADSDIERCGVAVGNLPFVTHCYRRPRHLPLWSYNLFAMVHGQSQAEVDAKIAEIAALLGDACRQHQVLFSEKVLKKTGLRLQKNRPPPVPVAE